MAERGEMVGGRWVEGERYIAAAKAAEEDLRRWAMEPDGKDYGPPDDLHSPYGIRVRRATPPTVELYGDPLDEMDAYEVRDERGVGV